MKNIIASVLFCIMFCTGCRSPYTGELHTPFSAISHERAFAAARINGWDRINGKWVHRNAIQAAGLMEPRSQSLSDRVNQWHALQMLAEMDGKTDEQIAKTYNGSGISLAKIGDGFVMGGLGAVIIWAGDEYVWNKDEEPSTQSTQSDKTATNHNQNDGTQTIVDASGDNNTINISYSNEN